MTLVTKVYFTYVMHLKIETLNFWSWIFVAMG